MEALGRRFSEVVEVTVTTGSDDEEVEPLTGSALTQRQPLVAMDGIII